MRFVFPLCSINSFLRQRFLKVTIDGQNVIEKVDIVRIENAAQGSNVPRGTHMDAQVAQNVVFVVSSLIKIDQHL